MSDSPKTKPSSATRAEEERDARVKAGVDSESLASEDAGKAADDAKVDPEVATHYEEMTERGADQRGEGRLP